MWDETPPTVLRAISQRYGQNATLKAQQSAKVDLLLHNVQQTLKIPLLSFQEEGVRRAIEMHGRILIADDMYISSFFVTSFSR